MTDEVTNREWIAASIWAGVFPKKATAEQIAAWRAHELATARHQQDAAQNLYEVCTAFLAQLGPDGYFPDVGKPLTDKMRVAVAHYAARQALRASTAADPEPDDLCAKTAQKSEPDGAQEVVALLAEVSSGGPHEWGYRDLTTGDFIHDDWPFRIATALSRHIPEDGGK